MSSQDTPIVTGETTIAELQSLMHGREVITLRVYRELLGFSVRAKKFGDSPHFEENPRGVAPTLAEALSALLAEIPEVRR